MNKKRGNPLETVIDIQFWTWLPSVLVGPFKFGTSIDDYIGKYGLCEYDTYCELNFGKGHYYKWSYGNDTSYYFENAYLIPQYDFAFVIYTTNGLIDNIAVETYLYYNNHDIIDTTIDEAMRIINRSTYDKVESQEMNDGIQQIYYFYSMGLTLWTRDGKVVTAFCNDGKEWMKDDNEI
jgi:hypothetical protein